MFPESFRISGFRTPSREKTSRHFEICVRDEIFETRFRWAAFPLLLIVFFLIIFADKRSQHHKFSIRIILKTACYKKCIFHWDRVSPASYCGQKSRTSVIRTFDPLDEITRVMRVSDSLLTPKLHISFAQNRRLSHKVFGSDRTLLFLLPNLRQKLCRTMRRLFRTNGPFWRKLWTLMAILRESSV